MLNTFFFLNQHLESVLGAGLPSLIPVLRSLVAARRVPGIISVTPHINLTQQGQQTLARRVVGDLRQPGI